MKRVFNYMWILIMLILAMIWIYPIFVVLINSLKTDAEFFTKGVFSLPEGLNITNYRKAWLFGGFYRYYKNSLIVTFTKVPLGILVSALAAYPLAKWNFRLRDYIFYFFILGLAIPINVTLLPNLRTLKSLNLLNSILVLYPPYIAFGIPFQVLVLRGFFRGIPNELIEAAKIDGCNEFRIFRSIIIPLSKPALASLFIIDFLATWNEFLMALVFIQTEELKTVPIGLMNFFGQYSSTYTAVLAGIALAIVPILAVYVFLQRYFVSGTVGAIKG